MALEIHVLAHVDPLPTVNWHWHLETGILSGSIPGPDTGAGFTGTVELNDDEGSIVVLDVNRAVLCGVDVVVWPERIEIPGLAAPVEARHGRVIVPSRSVRRGAASLEFDATLSLSANPAGDTCHIRIGIRRPVEAVRIADHLLIEVDASQRLAGFWLDRVPSAPPIGQ
jgi:hypothetical protein